MASAVLKRFYEEGEPTADLPLVQWSCEQLLYECEEAIRGIIANFPVRWARVALRVILIPFGSRRSKPSDYLGHQLAKMLTEPNETRSRLTRLAYSEANENCPVGRLEEAFHKICAVEELERKVIKAAKEHTLKSLSLLNQIEEAFDCGLITKDEMIQLKEAELARQDVIKVDDFSDEELRRVNLQANQVAAKKKIISTDDMVSEVLEH